MRVAQPAAEHTPFRRPIRSITPERESILRLWLPGLILKGVQGADVRQILNVLLGPNAPEVLQRNLAALRRTWTREFKDSQARNLRDREYAQRWIDAVTVRSRIESGEQDFLVIFGAGSHGPRELIG